tara:strand:+ start:280 stop:426 length:147 start_codon:yes stop_codon:yes gene_type:complete
MNKILGIIVLSLLLRALVHLLNVIKSMEKLCARPLEELKFQQNRKVII